MTGVGCGCNFTASLASKSAHSFPTASSFSCPGGSPSWQTCALTFLTVTFLHQLRSVMTSRTKPACTRRPAIALSVVELASLTTLRQSDATLMVSPLLAMYFATASVAYSAAWGVCWTGELTGILALHVTPAPGSR